MTGGHKARWRDHPQVAEELTTRLQAIQHAGRSR
jgi:hypothetical protein